MSDFIPLAIPNIGEEEGINLQKCVETNFVSSVGPFVDELEESLAQKTGGQAAAAVSSGTAALHLSFVALGVQKNDLVLMPSFTFIATANAVAHCGAQPFLCDVGEDSWNIDVKKLTQLLEQTCRVQDGVCQYLPTGQRVSALCAVYCLGTPADMDALRSLANTYHLALVADAAAAIGARYKEQEIGALADLTTLSFNGNKTLTAGGGGAVVGNTEIIARVKHLSTQARIGQEYDHDTVGYNYRMTNVQAVIACAQLGKLEQFIEKKRAIAGRYRELAQSSAKFQGFPEPDYCESAAWFSGIVCENEEDALNLISALQDAKIGARRFWKPMHTQAPFVDCPRDAVAVSDAIWSRIVTLPCSTGLSMEDLDRVCNCVLKWSQG